MRLLNWFKKSSRERPDNERERSLYPNDPFPEPITIEITDVFDLHTIQPREVKAVVQEYLEQARAIKNWDFKYRKEGVTARAALNNADSFAAFVVGVWQCRSAA